jgi:hypothetical protein
MRSTSSPSAFVLSRPLPSRRATRAAGTFLLAISFFAIAAPRAFAQQGFGLQGGGTLDPDQGFFGMYVISRPLAGDLRVHPGADVGFGNDVILAALHIDFAQWFELNPRWHLYFGGGPVVNIYRFDTVRFGAREAESFTEVEGGFDTIVGFAHDTGLTFEMRVGSNGSPDLRFGVGYVFD